MKKTFLSILLLALLCCVSFLTKAQSALSLYYLENIPQTSSINPAMAPRANMFIGIPGINSIYGGLHTDIFGPDIFQKVDGKYETLTNEAYNFNPFYKRIGKTANFNTYESIAPLVFGFKGKMGYFTFSWTEKLNQSVAIPKDLFTIIDNGGLKAGTKLNLNSFALNTQYYRELSFGYSYQFMSNLRVGVHAKLLQGLAAIKTDISSFSLDVNYDDPVEQRHVNYNMNMNGTVYMSAPIEVNSDENGSLGTIEKPKSDLNSLLDNGVFNFSNPGFAIDLGALYNYTEDWSFSGSINDLGFINWNGDLNSFTANGQYKYTGLPLDITDSDSSTTGMTELMDSLKHAVKFTHGNKGFSTGLGPKIYLGALYQVNYYFSVGGLSRTIFAKNSFRQEFNVSANLNLYHVLTTTINYTLAINGANNFGFGLGLRGGPIQFYIAADYLPYAYRTLLIESNNSNGNPQEIPFTPTRLENFNLMFGLNLVFGANGFRDKPMIDAYNEF